MADSQRPKGWDIFLLVLGSLVFAIIAGLVVNAVSGKSGGSNSDPARIVAPASQ
jgi:hypothetical protein